MSVLYVDVDKIRISERFRKDLGDLDELIESIKHNGLIMPIAVRDNNDGTYTLIAGGRRLTCFQKLAAEEGKYKQIPAKIFKHDMTDVELREAELAENLIRKNMSWSEEVLLKSKIHNMMIEKYGKRIGKTEDAPGWDNTKTARILNTSQATISRDLQLADALQTFPDLSKAKNKSEAIRIIEKARTNFSHAQVEKKLKEIKNNETQESVKKRELCDRYIIADALKEILNFPDNYFDLIECDPPYGISFNKHERKDNRNLSATGYNEIHSDDYPEFLNTILTLCYNKIKPTGWVLFWHSLSPWYSVIRDISGTLGFTSNHFPALWIKSAASNQNPIYNLARNYENFFYLRKGPARLAKPGSLSTFITPMNSGMRIHPTERPVTLMSAILTTFLTPATKAKVLVPFCGSGNTLLACTELGLEGIGYDLNPDYRNGFVSRVMKHPYGDYKNIRQKEKKNG